jgi:hypothetical protein
MVAAVAGGMVARVTLAALAAVGERLALVAQRHQVRVMRAVLV